MALGRTACRRRVATRPGCAVIASAGAPATGARGVGDNGRVTQGAGKRSATRKGSKQPFRFRIDVALLAALVTAAVVAWGFLVWFAIDFGTRARGGESGAWWLMAATGVGAVACLFVALMLLARLARALGLTSGAASTSHAARTASPSSAAPGPAVVAAALPPPVLPPPVVPPPVVPPPVVPPPVVIEPPTPPVYPGPDPADGRHQGRDDLSDTAERPAIGHGRHEASS